VSGSEPGHTPRQYALRRSEEELRRLSLQDELLHESTVSLLERAGVGEGMRVLDVGSGAGDVAITVARMVGPAGSVVGVELDQPSAEHAERRAHQSGFTNVEIRTGDVATLDLPGPFDAIVGRLVLMHLADPAAVLSRLRTFLRAGGLVVFQEMHGSRRWISFPPSPALEGMERVRSSALATGRAVFGEMGLALRDTFLRAGLPDPKLTVDAIVGGGPGWPGYGFLEETARSLLDTWRRVGAEGADDFVVDGLAERIEHEVGDTGTVMIHTLVGAWSQAL
jgi:2-polyprenyl-3-methyl-5-hydroxy-6-metoxy-1,4-benzoquinol methylase